MITIKEQGRGEENSKMERLKWLKVKTTFDEAKFYAENPGASWVIKPFPLRNRVEVIISKDVSIFTLEQLKGLASLLNNIAERLEQEQQN